MEEHIQQDSEMESYSSHEAEVESSNPPPAIKPQSKKNPTVKELILEKNPEFFSKLDSNIKLFAREIRKELRNQGHVVIGMTGYPGVGKSNAAAIIGMLIDDKYSFNKNVCFIPTSEQIEKTYLELNKYSYLHIDEASRGLHKHKWYDKIQQKLNELYDTEREGHYLSSCLIMPRFQNFAENFRNFMITYWIHIPKRGIAIFYKKDEDKDAKDPWHIDENYRAKAKKWRHKRVFERRLRDVVSTEQMTSCYWFWAPIPPIPEDVWQVYQQGKKDSRVASKEELDLSNPVMTRMERMHAEKKKKMNEAVRLLEKGFNMSQIGMRLGVTRGTVHGYIKEHKELNEEVDIQNEK